ncbi:MAG: hypothetical protein RDU41_00200 [Clostridia bacterium]|nr:hypothetical protein [Clostridia bacterium]
MPDERMYREESPAVQAHLGIAQSIIQRMAANSASCKAWCITLVAAILVIVADKGQPAYALIAAIPTLLFLVLDTYYLALEKCFRDSYNEFIDKIHDGRVVAADLYAITPKGSLPRSFARSLRSFSIWPFYVTLALMIWLSMYIVIS